MNNLLIDTFNVVYADPPWEYRHKVTGRGGRGYVYDPVRDVLVRDDVLKARAKEAKVKAREKKAREKAKQEKLL